jgi:four helix bundle protein
MDLVVRLYAVTGGFPSHESYALTSQIRKAAVSIPSNIAEGQGKSTPGERRLHLGHARGSLCEIETQVSIAERLGYVSTEVAEDILWTSAGIRRSISALLNELRPR